MSKKKIILILISILLVILFIMGGFLFYLKSINLANLVSGTYLASVENYDYTPEADERYIAEHGAQAHEYFSNRPQFFQRLIIITPINEKEVNLHVYIANEKGDTFEQTYNNLMLTASLSDLFEYQFNDTPLSIRLNHKDTFPSRIYIEKNSNDVSLSISGIETQSNQLAKMINYNPSNYSPYADYTRQKSCNKTSDDWKQVVHEQLNQTIITKKKEKEEFIQELKNTQEYYDVFMR